MFLSNSFQGKKWACANYHTFYMRVYPHHDPDHYCDALGDCLRTSTSLLFDIICTISNTARSYLSTSHDQWVSLMAWSWGRENLSQSDSKRLYLPVKVKSCNPLIHRNMLILRRKVSQNSLLRRSRKSLKRNNISRRTNLVPNIQTFPSPVY